MRNAVVFTDSQTSLNNQRSRPLLAVRKNAGRSLFDILPENCDAVTKSLFFETKLH